ncbi:hypothetical protein BU16DRAFT_522317 [Lophium mytilinum]|uniref:DUF8040 domain-containing protein n=1 Tax=Lophium mytilinum TaxID=390894 RepID=A0A6A6R9Z2_9PEZI|nr:hypothetical protein BU16DRAFT_522317 [Lophium mytilinum]
MECPTASPIPVGRSRSLSLLNGVPNRFYDFSRMDQITFVQLADWCMEHKTPVSAAEDISIEECLFIFLDIAGQGTSFREAAQSWGHPEDIIKKIFLGVVEWLRALKEDDEVPTSSWTQSSQSTTNKNKWRVLKTWRNSRRAEGFARVGEEGGDGIEVNKDEVIEALTALNNFIHDHKE